MRIFAISDLHLPGNDDKPMDIFGMHWENHWGQIQENWLKNIASEDVVLIPGDISWAMVLDEALQDLEAIGQLPGKKIIIRGNHDYWWSSISRIRSVLPSTVYALQNDSLKLGTITFCGTRGWATPGLRGSTDHDSKIFNRELHRLKLSLDSVKGAENIIVLLHYPPFDEKGQENEIGLLIREYPVNHVVFGHLHGEGLRNAIEGNINGLNYHLVSCDYLNFSPKLILGD